MKCDKLQYTPIGQAYFTYPARTLVIDKASVDEAVSELKDKLRHYPMMAALLDNDNQEIRKQKRNRCLAMRNYCLSELELAFRNPCLSESVRGCVFFRRWANKWSELADKFKDGK